MTDKERINQLQAENTKLKQEVTTLKNNHHNIDNGNNNKSNEDDLKQVAKKRIYNIVLEVAKRDIPKVNKIYKKRYKRLQKAHKAHPLLNPPVSDSDMNIINLDKFSDDTAFKDSKIIHDINTIFGLDFYWDEKYTVKELTNKVCYYTLPVLGLEALIRHRRIHQEEEQQRRRSQDDSDDTLMLFP